MNNRLSSNEIKELIQIQNKCKLKAESDKLKCVIYWGQAWSWNQIKNALFISDGTIKSYIDKYKSGGVKDLLLTHYDGHNRKLTKNQEEKMVKYIINNNMHNTKQICEYIKKEFGIIYTSNGIVRTLNRLGFIYNKPEENSYQVDSYLQGIHLGLSYLHKLSTIKENENIYFVNVDCIDNNSKIDYGWEKIDEDSKSKYSKDNEDTTVINIFMAYNLRTYKVINVSQSDYPNDDPKIILIKKILKANTHNDKIHLILYNIPINKNKKLLKFINKQKIKIELTYVPSYKPKLKFDKCKTTINSIFK